MTIEECAIRSAPFHRSDEALARHIGSVIRSKKHVAGCYFFRLPRTSERRVRAKFCHIFFRKCRRNQRRRNWSGRHAIDPSAFLGQPCERERVNATSPMFFVFRFGARLHFMLAAGLSILMLRRLELLFFGHAEKKSHLVRRPDVLIVYFRRKLFPQRNIGCRKKARKNRGRLVDFPPPYGILSVLPEAGLL